jgi:hypothetical protein
VDADEIPSASSVRVDHHDEPATPTSWDVRRGDRSTRARIHQETRLHRTSIGERLPRDLGRGATLDGASPRVETWAGMPGGGRYRPAIGSRRRAPGAADTSPWCRN